VIKTKSTKKSAKKAGEAASDKQVTDATGDSLSQVEQLQLQLVQAQESERRAQADYQNVVRRSRDERLQFVKMATKDLVTDLLQPLEHLGLAAGQIDDTGLNMVVSQLWQKLADHGLEEIEVMGLPFDVSTMEAVENGESATDEQSDLVVTQVQRAGYKLSGQVVQFARVVMGSK
jgi:molecular chaperone GrpE